MILKRCMVLWIGQRAVWIWRDVNRIAELRLFYVIRPTLIFNSFFFSLYSNKQKSSQGNLLKEVNVYKTDKIISTHGVYIV